jgi:F-type H+-transporting ATPase subunit delta
MKINPKKYALALYESVALEEGAIENLLKNFVKILVKNNDLSKAKKIEIEFNKIWNKKKGIVDANIISAKKTDQETLEIIENYIKKISGSPNVNMQEEIDKDMIGGIIIKYEDKILDGSLRTSLKTLKEKLSA